MGIALGSPILGYVGQKVGLFPDGQNPNNKYKVIASVGDGWDNGASSQAGATADGSRLYVPQQTGYHSIGVQGFNPDGALVENVYSGQFLVLDRDQAISVIREHSARLNVTEYDGDVSRQASEQDWRAGISSFDQFIDYVSSQQQAATPIAGMSDQASKAFFFMQWVSGLWAYGNPTQFNLPGCVMNNEITGAIDPATASIRTYLESPIGCCTDYTVLLGMLMTAAGFETRVVYGAGHVFNEAFIDGQWWTLDANLNLAYRAPWNEVIDPSKQVDIIRFEHEGMREGSAIYRDALADFYQYHLAQVEIGSFDQGYRAGTSAFFSTLPYNVALSEGLHNAGWVGSDSDWNGYLLSKEVWLAGDFDGNGRADLLTTASTASQINVALSANGEISTPTTWSSTIKRDGSVWVVGDFNGDGRDDIFSYKATSVDSAVYTSTGMSFTAAASGLAVNSGAVGWSVGDFNGDGRDDVMRMVNGVTGAEVYLSTGAGFVLSGGWNGFGSGSQGWYVGDFNGDGRDDIAGFNQASGQTTVLISTGSSFVSAGSWTTAGQGSQAFWYVADYNGDGRDDLGRYIDGVGFQALFSTGSQFQGPTTLAPEVSANGHSLYTADFDGDGVADIAFTTNPFNNGNPQALTEQTDSNGFSDEYLISLLVRGVQRLDQREFDSPVAAEAAQQGWRSGVHSLSSLTTLIDSRYLAASGADYLDGLEPETARILFFAQWYGGLWTPGDGSDESVVDNHITGATDPTNVLLSTFLESPIGSARDAASLLASMLTAEGVDNWVIATDRYVINEFYADGQWWSVNAGLGVAFEGRWHDVMNTANMPATFVFDMASMTAGTPTFSIDASEVQRDFIVEAGAGLLYDFDRYGAGEWLADQPYGDLFSDNFTPLHATLKDTAWVSPAHEGRPWSIGDFDGDGRTDILSYRPGVSGAMVQLSDGAAFGAGSSWTGAGYGHNGWVVGDFNGDSRDDVMRVIWGVSGADVFLSDGSKFNYSANWTAAGPGNQFWYVADFDGDGKDDLLRYVEGVSGAQVFRSTGTSFVGTGSWTPAGQGSGGKWFIGDFNGDGKEDLGRVLAGAGFQVSLSTGTAFKNPVTWNSEIQSGTNLRVSDLDGDGRDDLLVAGASPKVYLSSGTAFAEMPWELSSSASLAKFLADFDGNGAADLFDFGLNRTPTMHLSALDDHLEFITATAGQSEIFDVSLSRGSETISGFETTGAAPDQLKISKLIATDYAALMAVSEQVGIDSVFHLAAGLMLTVKGTLLSDYTSGHFVFA